MTEGRKKEKKELVYTEQFETRENDVLELLRGHNSPRGEERKGLPRLSDTAGPDDWPVKLKYRSHPSRARLSCGPIVVPASVKLRARATSPYLRARTVGRGRGWGRDTVSRWGEDRKSGQVSE